MVGWGGGGGSHTHYCITPVPILGAGALMFNAWDWTVTTALIGVYSATLNEDEFEIDEESREIRSRKDQFLKSIESRIDPTSSDQKERFIEIKNQILDKVRKTKVSRLRSRSGSNVGSPSSRKRSLSSPREDPRTSSRPRTNLPVPSTK